MLGAKQEVRNVHVAHFGWRHLLRLVHLGQRHQSSIRDLDHGPVRRPGIAAGHEQTGL